MSDASVDCPLCSMTADSRSGVRRHLLVSHRKNALATALLDDAPGRDATPAAVAPDGE